MGLYSDFPAVSGQILRVSIAITLMSLQPIILISIGLHFFKQKTSWCAVAGTLVALIGVAVIFLV
jgi:drug/metabolite transporter (DMT)-like permease